MEIDVPLVIGRHYDQAKGIHYGQAMKKSRVMQQGGSYGLAGGLGVHGSGRPSRDEVHAPPAEIDPEALLENFEDANNKGHVMNKLTLGGRIAKPQNGKPNYYIGIFKSSEYAFRI